MKILFASLALWLGLGLAAHADTSLWQIGRPDNSAAEFADYRSAPVENVTIPATPSSVSKGLHAGKNDAMEITYTLPAIPAHGVVFAYKLLDAHKNGEQMGVFSNNLPAGLIQMWGTGGSASPFKWKKTYRIYIPKEMLHKGFNTLTLTARPATWMDAASDATDWWVWDNLRLDALSEPATEPLMGTLAWLGTTLKQNSNGFAVDQYTVAMAPIMFEWMGIAYSQNTIRTDFWYDVTSQQPGREDTFKRLAALNMTVCTDYLSGAHYTSADGSVPAKPAADLRAFFTRYSNYFQYYEIVNEPGNFHGNMFGDLAIATMVNHIKPSWVKTTAPGWAYAAGGVPKGYPQRVEDRRKIEDLCQATNGHSYGFSYNDDRGGSFMEQLKTFNGVEDGWPKEYVNTETGNNNWHSEQNGGTHLPSRQTHASNFERIMRAHIAVGSRAMQHASIFDDFGLFAMPASWADLTTLTAFPGIEGEDTRLKSFRRLALTYCTHGAPLPVTILNPEAVAQKMVICRCVDTSALPPLPGSGARSNRILLNFVNWEETPQTISVRVMMPSRGTWSGAVIGAGNTYATSHSAVTLTATPAVVLNVTLAPLESTQYILVKGPQAPQWATHVPSPDLLVTGITMAPAHPRPGDAVTFTAAVKNIGDAPTAEGTTLGVAFKVDGKQVSWADTFHSALKPGESVTVTANNGSAGKTWTMTADAAQVEALADDVDRIRESNEANNTLKVVIPH